MTIHDLQTLSDYRRTYAEPYSLYCKLPPAYQAEVNASAMYSSPEWELAVYRMQDFCDNVLAETPHDEHAS